MRACLLFILAAFCLPLSAAEVRSGETAKLHQLFDEQWEMTMQDSPEWASLLGDRRFNREWSDLSEEGRERRRARTASALQSLSEIDRDALPPEEQINYDLFKRMGEDDLEAFEFDTHLMPISQRGGIQTQDEFGDRIRLTSVQDYDDWLARLSKMDERMDQVITLMQTGIERGVVPPRITMSRIPAQIRKQIVDDPDKSLFFKPFANIPADIPARDRKRIQKDARRIIKGVVVPAYRELDEFFNETYLPATRDSIASRDLPNGKAFYEHRVRSYTTTNMTPDEVHQLGLEEVARNRREMMAIIEEVGFEGSFQDFIEFLRTDPQFYYETPGELFLGYLAISKRLDPLIVNLFGRLPRMPYGVVAIPDAVAPDTTTAYYTRPAADGSRPGYYYVNLYKPETRPKWEMEVLSVHEAVPGHHLQIALQMELEDLPNFRRYSGFTAFTEGWGLYSERLGYEMGLYKDPYSRFGQLTYDMWRAVRLVVDTGMHYKGWTRQQAIDYFMDNAPKTKLDITNEIDRYISWPGQALAYKLGQLKMLELRARAEDRLGDDFDVKAFHDTMLGSGAVPLNVLEDIIDTWIEAEAQQASD